MSERICPHCKNPIYDDDALSCHFCGESLGNYSSGGLGMMRSMQWILVVISAIIILMFVLSHV